MEMWISHDVTNKYGGLKPATCGMFNHVPSPNPISLATFAIVFQTFWGKTENKRDMFLIEVLAWSIHLPLGGYLHPLYECWVKIMVENSDRNEKLSTGIDQSV